MVIFNSYVKLPEGTIGGLNNIEPRTSTQCRQHGIVTDHAGLHRSLGTPGSVNSFTLEETLVPPKRDQNSDKMMTNDLTNVTI
jgi:hypothetical protein